MDRGQEVCSGMGKCVAVLDGQREVGKWVWCGRWCGEVGDGVTKWAAAWENGWRHGEVGGGNTRGSSVEGWQHGRMGGSVAKVVVVVSRGVAVLRGSVITFLWEVVALHWRGVMRQGRWVRQGMQAAVS